MFYYYKDIPQTYQVNVAGVTFSDKTLHYLLALQLLFASGGWASAVCGWMAGVLYSADMAGIKKWRFPRFLQRACTRFLPLLDSQQTSRSSTATTRAAFVRRPAPATRPPAPLAQQIEPTEENIAMLVSFGFDREAAIRALRASNNDVQRATNRLLDQ
jgi:hypothetical protein